MDVTSSVVPDKEKFKTASSSSYHEDTSALNSTSVSRGSIMKLGAKKTSNRTRKVKNEYPGSEYDILQNAAQSNEPDYFADMEPTVKFTDKDAKAKYARSQSAELSSKLIMVEDASQARYIFRLWHLRRGTVVSRNHYCAFFSFILDLSR